MSENFMMPCLASWLGSLRRWGFGGERCIYAALIKFMNDLSALIQRGEKNCSAIQLTESQKNFVSSYEYVQIWCKPSVRVLAKTHMTLYEKALFIKTVRQILHEWIFNGDGKDIDFEIRPLDPFCTDDDFCVVDDTSDDMEDDDIIILEDSKDGDAHEGEKKEEQDEGGVDDDTHKDEEVEEKKNNVDDNAPLHTKCDDDNQASAECCNENAKP